MAPAGMSKSACSGGRCRRDARAGRRPSPAFSGALRTCSSRVANGTVGLRLRQGIDYRPEMLDGPSVMKLAYSIFAHVIELSADGEPTNTTYVGHRAGQHIRGTPIDVRGRSAVRRLGGRAVRVSWRADCAALNILLLFGTQVSRTKVINLWWKNLFPKFPVRLQ